MYDLLVWSDPATGTLRAQIADSLELGDDRRTWTLRLRPGVRFTDGTAFDAEAVRFNWERHRDPTNRSPKLAATSEITALEVLDPRTPVARPARPNANFDRIVAGQLGFIGSPTAIRADPAGIDRAPVGAGSSLSRSTPPTSTRASPTPRAPPPGASSRPRRRWRASS
ncbi:ABC transporter substrate-binding protein [Streptodolium elevatio]|uniref:ABC transporter substrate-binding protein n=1 Tax=Streptodolium elevatio TaxID=3157996 RepID=A0ABV3DRH3_9ACTN